MNGWMMATDEVIPVKRTRIAVLDAAPPEEGAAAPAAIVGADLDPAGEDAYRAVRCPCAVADRARIPREAVEALGAPPGSRLAVTPLE